MLKSDGHHIRCRRQRPRARAKILARHEDRRPAAAPFTMHGSNGEKAEATMMIVRREKYDEDDAITDRHLVLATSKTYGSPEEVAEAVPEEYRRRWMIETAFRAARTSWERPACREMHVRVLLFCFALLLYNLWVPAGR